MLTTLRELLDEAEQRERAVLAFNVYNLEPVSAVADAAAESGVPVVFAFGEGYLRGASLAMIAAIVRQVVDEYGMRAALHLDHAKNPDTVRAALTLGFTSVMFDGSALPYAENAAATAALVREARRAGASVEAELGGLNAEDDSDDGAPRLFTDPAHAAAFVRETGVDALAVAVGNAHGVYKEEPALRIELIEKIARSAKLPLVLHGGSSIPEEQMLLAIRAGIRKINVNTELALSGTKAIAEYAAATDRARLEKALEKARAAMKAVAREAISRYSA